MKTPTAVAEFLISQVKEFDDQVELTVDKVKQCVIANLQGKMKENDRITNKVVSLLNLRLAAQHQFLHMIQQTSGKSFTHSIVRQQEKVRSMHASIRLQLVHMLLFSQRKRDQMQQLFFAQVNQFIKRQNQQLIQYENTKQLLDPAQILKRGYTMAYADGKLIKSVNQLKTGDIIENRWIDGKASSTVFTLNQTDPYA